MQRALDTAIACADSDEELEQYLKLMDRLYKPEKLKVN